MLGKAITCAILAKAGPRRTRIMKQLVKDDKLQSLDQLPKYAVHTVVLKKMNLNQLLTREELRTLVSSLLPHQQVVSWCSYAL